MPSSPVPLQTPPPPRPPTSLFTFRLFDLRLQMRFGCEVRRVVKTRHTLAVCMWREFNACQVCSDPLSLLISSRLTPSEFKQEAYIWPFNSLLSISLLAGHSCKLLTKNMGMLVINEDTLDVSINK